MKKSELIALIREVIKKEMSVNIQKQVKLAVEKQLNEIFITKGRESLLGSASPQPTNFAGMEQPVSMVEAMNSHSSQPGYQQPPVTKRNYVSNPILNDILNNTPGGIPQGDGIPSFDMEMSEDITKALQEQYGGKIDGKARLEIGAIQSAKAAGVNVSDVPEGVMLNLTRNYSDVLNKSKQLTDRKAGKI